jgi:hypothetical protein
MICDDEKRTVRALIMHIDFRTPVDILPVPAGVFSYGSPIRTACLIFTVISPINFTDGSEAATLTEKM